jgi:MYXO-CTERM domain-containing protein
VFWVALVAVLPMRQALAGPDYFSTGDGHSGVLTVAAGQSVTVNSYTGLAVDVAAAATTITVDDAAAVQAGDLVMLWQAAGLADPGTATEQNTVDITGTNVGRFEFARVVSKNDGTDTIVLVDPLTNSFSAASTQVVLVPEYSSASIAATGRIIATPWNGDIGGIAVFLVNGVLANNGSIDVIGAGFRGGIQKGNSGTNGCSMLNPLSNSAVDLANTAQKGEGIVSSRYNDNARARSNVINGGGGGVCHNSSGGGGGHAGAGGKGGRTWRGDPDLAIPGNNTGRDVGGFGGTALTYNVTQRLTLGGGGGAGQQNNNIGGTGASGGGIIFVRAGSVTGTGLFTADGVAGNPSTGGANDSAGAAGAGGSVVVRSAGGLACTTASARGGIGGSVNFQDHGPGGGGGGGYVLFQSQTAVCARVVTGGAPGTQTDLADFAGPSYGATAGSAGTDTLLSSSFPTDSDVDGIPDVEEGATDTDGDGVPNFLDADDDNDGLLTSVETDTDTDGDGIPNHLDKDSDNDGIPDVVEAGATDGGNGVLAGFTDANDDGVDDTLAGSPITPPNTDSGGPADYLDLDSDGDGIPDAQEVGLETDPNGDVLGFTDANGDGLLDDYPTDQPNTDNAGAPDFLDTDSDGDGLLDGLEAFDTDGDGTQNLIAIGNDHDSDGIDDQFDGSCPGGGGCMGGGNTIDLGNLTAAQDADQNGTGDWLEVCVDGYVTGAEACDDGDNDNDNECANSCLLNLGETCGMNGECVSAFCDGNVCSACTDDVSGGTDTGCAMGSPVCRDNGGLNTCTTCADTAMGAGIDEGCAGGAPQCDEVANGGLGSCVGCMAAADCDDSNACTADACTAGACANTNVPAGNACLDGVVGTCDAAQVCVPDGECATNADCAAPTPACNTALPAPICVTCVVDADCAAGACTAQNTCVACVDDQAGATLDRGCTGGAPMCQVQGGSRVCVACQNTAAAGAVDLGCGGATPTCDTSTPARACVDCTATADCAVGEVCTPAKTCAPACTTTPDCASTPATPACDTNNLFCVECVLNSDCAPTQECAAQTCGVPDTDGDGVADDADPDSDNDGIRDIDELGGTDRSIDSDNDDVADYADPDFVACTDANMDGACDTLPPSVDFDGDGIPNHLDLDADGDGIVDLWENRGSALDTNRDGQVDNEVDADGDGLLAAFDDNDTDAAIMTTQAPKNRDMTGGPDHLDLDADGDGITDVVEANGVDADGDGRHDGTDGDGNGIVAAIDPGEVGVALSPPDTDNDNTVDDTDAGAKFGFDFEDADSDGDGIGDYPEGFDVNADGAADVPKSNVDANADGIDDAFAPPAGTRAPLPDRDLDTKPDFRDVDDDADAVDTADEIGPEPQNPRDLDNDGTPDYLDPDMQTPVDAGIVDAGADDAGVVADAGVGDAAVPAADAGTPPVDPVAPDASAADAGSVPLQPPLGQPVGLAGGAGCATAPSSGPHSGYWALALLGLVPFLRRRRTQALPLLALALLFTPNDARAQQAGFNLNRYRPAETAHDQFQLSRPNDLGDGKISVQLLLDYAKDPLVIEAQQGSADSELASVVGNQFAAHGTFALGLGNRFVLFAGLPVNLVMSGDDNPATVSADGAAPGDPWVGARVRLVGEKNDIAALALQAGLTIPLANLADDQQAYAGDKTVTGHPELLFELRPGDVRITANVGALVKKATTLVGASTGSEFTYGLGFTLTPSEALDLVAELHGGSAFSQFFEREESPLELLLGGKYHAQSGMTFGLAAGPGLTRGIGSPDVRVVGMVGFATPDEPEPEHEPEVPTATDRDKDGILDTTDRCPDEPEDKDEFEDKDGCPDPDNDQDKILDTDDKCPGDPEDKDGFEDENGCPDPDNDQDKILDGDDSCPNEPEDVDTFEDENGCPDPDNDGDEVLDVDDECPLVPGAKDAKGCPKTIRVEKSQIVILDRVEFATGRDKILERSFPILEEVRAVLKATPTLKRMRVEGHTDSRGSDPMNLDLSVRRSRSVMRWLIEAGIEAARVEAYGCGETRPSDTNDTEAGRQTNRRVEFHVLDPNPGEPRSTEGCVRAE